MADYSTSTQRQKWLLTPDVLADRRAKANFRAAESLRQHGTTKVEPQADAVSAYLDNRTANGEGCVDPNVTLPEPLSIEDEAVIRKFYESKIHQVCEAFHFPIKVQATAILYFKRFYLQWSVMEQDVKEIMLTCIYVACKVEEVYVSAEEFGKGMEQNPRIVLDNELVVLQTLEFELITHSPYRPITGFLADIEPFRRDLTAKWEEDQEKLRAAAYMEATRMMFTDAPLLYPPGQLALAALLSANDREDKVDLNSYLESVVSRHGKGHSLKELTDTLQQIIQLVEREGKPADESLARTLDRQLKYCRNPSLLQDEQRKKERRERKKSKRASHEVKSNMDLGSGLEGTGLHDSKRRKSTDVIMS